MNNAQVWYLLISATVIVVLLVLAIIGSNPGSDE